MLTNFVPTLANIHIHMIVCCVTMQCVVYIIENNLYTAEITMNTIPH